MFSLQVLGAVAQLERALIADRSKAGLASARARGRVGGNPGVRAGDPAAIAKIVKSMDETYVTRLIDGMETFMPTVRNMRPISHGRRSGGRGDARQPASPGPLSGLRQSVRRLVAEGLVDRKVMGRAATAPSPASDEFAVLVQGIALANPECLFVV